MVDKEKKDVAIRKRQKIQNSNKTMFIWVAAMSALVGLSLVISWFLFEQMLFRNKVISEKRQTLSIVKHNNNISSDLIANIRKHESDEGLNKNKADNDEAALQVILDALPSKGNSLALGGSLQKKLLAGIPGVKVKSIKVDPVGGSKSDTSSESKSEDEGTGLSRINFTFSVEFSDINKLRELLFRLEHSIRAIYIDNMRLERADDRYTIFVEAHAYYLPAKSIDLKEKVVKP